MNDSGSHDVAAMAGRTKLRREERLRLERLLGLREVISGFAAEVIRPRRKSPPQERSAFRENANLLLLSAFDLERLTLASSSSGDEPSSFDEIRSEAVSQMRLMANRVYAALSVANDTRRVGDRIAYEIAAHLVDPKFPIGFAPSAMESPGPAFARKPACRFASQLVELAGVDCLSPESMYEATRSGVEVDLLSGLRMRFRGRRVSYVIEGDEWVEAQRREYAEALESGEF